MPVRFIGRTADHSSKGNLPRTLYGKPFPPDDVQALWNMWPTVVTVYWYPGIATFQLIEHVYGVQMNMGPEKAHSYDQWLIYLRAMEDERERKRLAGTTPTPAAVCS